MKQFFLCQENRTTSVMKIKENLRKGTGKNIGKFTFPAWHAGGCNDTASALFLMKVVQSALLEKFESSAGNFKLREMLFAQVHMYCRCPHALHEKWTTKDFKKRISRVYFLAAVPSQLLVWTLLQHVSVFNRPPYWRAHRSIPGKNPRHELSEWLILSRGGVGDQELVSSALPVTDGF